MLVGASSASQLADNVAALDNLDFTDEELARIDRPAVDAGIDLWGAPGGGVRCGAQGGRLVP